MLLVVAILTLLIGALVAASGVFSPGPAQKSVPNVVNMTQQQAERALEQAGLALGGVELQASADVPKNRIISQDPESGGFLDEGGEVDILVSEGPPEVVVPDVRDLDKEEARAVLEDEGLRVRLRERESDEEADTVIETDPRAATSVAVDSLVTVFFSDGPEEVPSVVGKQEDAARQAIDDAGFTASVEYDSETRAEPGTVLDQTPDAGETLSQGAAVTIVVSDYEEPTPTPTPEPTPTAEPTPTQEPSPSPSASATLGLGPQPSETPQG